MLVVAGDLGGGGRAADAAAAGAEYECECGRAVRATRAKCDAGAAGGGA